MFLGYGLGNSFVFHPREKEPSLNGACIRVVKREDWEADGGIGLRMEAADTFIEPAPASDAGAGGALTVRSTAEESPRTLKLLIIRQQVRAVTGGLHARSV